MPDLPRLLPVLPKPLDQSFLENVWGLFTLNPKYDPESPLKEKKYGVSCRSNGPLKQFTKLKRNGVPVLSLTLFNKVIKDTGYKLIVLDADWYGRYAQNFDKELFNDLCTATYTEYSPSGKGAHIFLMLPRNTVLKPFEGEAIGLDIRTSGFITMTFKPFPNSPSKIKVATNVLASTTKLSGKFSKENWTPMDPYNKDGSLSPIWCYNMQTDIAELFDASPDYVRVNTRFLHKTSTSGDPGVVIYQGMKGSWDGCVSNHDDNLPKGFLDPWGVHQSFIGRDYFDKESMAKSYKEIKAIDPETGEILDISVHQFNKNKKISKQGSIEDVIVDLKETSTPPSFEEEILDCLPSPFPELIANYTEMIFNPLPVLYMPMFMATHEVLLQGKVKTIRGRTCNMHYTTGSLSSGGKDDNTSEAIIHYLRAILSMLPQNPQYQNASKMIQRLWTPLTVNFSSGTNYLQALHETKIHPEGKPLGGVVLSTESTGFYQKLNSSNENIGMIIADIEIEMYNGMKLSPRSVGSKQKEHLGDIDAPNYSTNRMTQLDPFMRIISMTLFLKGYGPRLFEIYDLAPDEEYVPSSQHNEKVRNPNEDMIHFLYFVTDKLAELDEIQVVCNKTGGDIHAWEMKVLAVLHKRMEADLFPGVKRIPQMAEKWVATITAYVYFWKLYKGYDVTPLILGQKDKTLILDGKLMEQYVIPMMNYQAKVKHFTIYNNIIASVSKSDDVISNIWHSCIEIMKQDKKHGKTYGPWLVKGVIPYPMFADKVKKNKDILRDHSEDKARIEQTLLGWLTSHGLQAVAGVIGSNGKKRVCVMEKI